MKKEWTIRSCLFVLKELRELRFPPGLQFVLPELSSQVTHHHLSNSVMATVVEQLGFQPPATFKRICIVLLLLVQFCIILGYGRM